VEGSRGQCERSSRDDLYENGGASFASRCGRDEQVAMGKRDSERERVHGICATGNKPLLEGVVFYAHGDTGGVESEFATKGMSELLRRRQSNQSPSLPRSGHRFGMCRCRGQVPEKV
jgi:hypothetical protein